MNHQQWLKAIETIRHLQWDDGNYPKVPSDVTFQEPRDIVIKESKYGSE